ncbi:hypothetical protein, partial [Bradyrhizobium sp.]
VQAQAEIASALMGLPLEQVLPEVKKASRVAARTNTRVITADQGTQQRAVVVERRTVRRFNFDKRTGT